MKELINQEQQEICKTKLITPFEKPEKGENLTWVALNKHSDKESLFGFVQNYGYDFAIIDKEDSSCEDKTNAESYFCYAEKVISPGNGTIIHITDGLNDEFPFLGEAEDYKPNIKNTAGNNIIIDHENGEYSFIAHLKKDSIKVKTGDRIKQGDEIGLVGNSGNTSSPHIHYHMFKVRNGYSIEDIIEAKKKPYGFLNLADNERNEKNARKSLDEIMQIAEKHNIKPGVRIEEWPDEITEKLSPAITAMVGIETVFQNNDNKTFKKGEKIKFNN